MQIKLCEEHTELHPSKQVEQ